MIVRFADIGGIGDHHCLDLIQRYLGISNHDGVSSKVCGGISTERPVSLTVEFF